MKEPAWEKCHYYSSGRCPENSTIDKAYLIPQLLKPSEIKAANDTCEECENYHEEKRKHRRIARPFRVVVSNEEPKQNTEGTIVDVSTTGALLKLDNWRHFNKDEIIKLKLYSKEVISGKEQINVVSVCGQVKRVSKNKQELAIIFVEDDSVKKCANI